MSKNIIIKVTNNVNKFINKCIKYKIELLNISYIDSETILVKIGVEDLERIKKINYYSEIDEYKVLGIDRLILFFKRNLLTFITVLICFFVMYFLENVIVDIEIIHSNKQIIELVREELEKNNIKTFTFAKNFDELESLRVKIIEENPTKLEWMSITRVGMKYVVRVEERIITEVEENASTCHIVAKKNGIIKNIKSTSGEIVPAINDYVRKGDVLISGQIHLYEEIKNNICAEGEVYAEVWYSINLSIPLEYQEKKYTGATRYNFIIKKKQMFKNKYALYDEEVLKEVNLFGLNVKYIKEKEYENLINKYSYDEAEVVALKKVDQNMKMKLKDNGKILSKKILKKTQFNSRIDIEVFVVVEENISESINYEIVGDINGNT